MELTSSKEKFISSLKKGDIILSRNEKDLIESIVCKAVPDARWPHCRLYIDHGKSVESTVGGVQVKEVQEYLDTAADRVNRALAGIDYHDTLLTEGKVIQVMKKEEEILALWIF